MTVTPNWFEVSREGLGKLLERRGKQFALYELVQNAWDAAGTTVCRVELSPVPGRPLAKLVVTDDAPEGFRDLTHTYTLFAESERKGDAEKRGRFNLGEKLVLALCREASVSSTTGTYHFTEAGRGFSRVRTAGGSEFRATLAMTHDECAAALAALQLLLPPPHMQMAVNGAPLPGHAQLAVVFDALPTEVADAEGVLRRTARKTMVRVVEARPGEAAMLYEMGIPVVETGDRWHVDVMQKVPLTFERDNVTPSYLRAVRTLVANAMREHLTPTDVTTQWVRDATSDARCLPETMAQVLDLRYGAQRVSYDPSDKEANHRAVAAGYKLVYGAEMGGTEWEHARAAGLRPAGQVFPTHGETVPGRTVPVDEWTAAMKRIVLFTRLLGNELIGAWPTVSIIDAPTASTAADWKDLHLRFNVGVLGPAWFEGSLPNVLPLLLHEFAHHFEANHLDDKFADAVADLGTKATLLALREPTKFDGVPR